MWSRLLLIPLFISACSYDYVALRGQGGGSGTGGSAAVVAQGSGGAGQSGGGGMVVSATGGTGANNTGSGGRLGSGGAPGSGGRDGNTDGSGGGVAFGSGGTTATGGQSGAGGAGGQSGTGGIIAMGGATQSGGAGGLPGSGGAPSSDPDLVLWYPFEETSGATANDLSASAGGPRNGTLGTAGTGGGASFSAAAQVGGRALALTANGVNGGGYVSVPSVPTLAPDAITIAVWVYATGNQRWQRVFDFGNDTLVYMFLTVREGTDSNNRVRFAITTAGNGTAEQRIDSAAILPLSTWHHLAVVLPAGTSYIGTLYIDGVAVGTNAAMTLHPASLGTTVNNYLGRSPFATDPYFAGALDDFRVYKRALTPAEITALYTLR